MAIPSNEEIMVVFDPAAIDTKLLTTIYSLMKEECDEIQIKNIPKIKNKSSYSYQ